MRIILIFIVIIPLFCFSQKDTSKFINNFYLELNGGVGIFKHSEKYQSPSGSYIVGYSNLSYNLSANLVYRNKRLLFGATGQTLYFYENILSSISLYTGLNVLSKTRNKNYFFGPRFSYGYIIRTHGRSDFPRFSLGIDSYIKKFHFGLRYDWIITDEKSTFILKPRNLYLEIGYAFNLESFRKKK